MGSRAGRGKPQAPLDLERPQAQRVSGERGRSVCSPRAPQEGRREQGKPVRSPEAAQDGRGEQLELICSPRAVQEGRREQ